MSAETLAPIPTPGELDAMVFGGQVVDTHQTTEIRVPTSAFEALVENPAHTVQDSNLVNVGTYYTMPEGDTDK